MSVLVANNLIKRTRGKRFVKIGPRLSGFIVATIIMLAVIGPFIAPYDPNATDLNATNAGFSNPHWLGTDDLGRDILSRILCGAPLSLAGPLLVMLISILIGTVVSLIAVWYAGRVDDLVSIIVSINLAFPSLLLAILSTAVFGPGIVAPSIALSFAYIPYCIRQIRAVALKESSLPYIQSLYVQGFGAFSICCFHVLPNIFSMLLALAALAFSYAMVDLAAISYLGLGVQPPYADWGSMVAQGQLGLQQGAPEAALVAGGVILLIAIAFNAFGESIASVSSGR